MSDFTTSLIREKFVIQSKDGKDDPIIALSNRIVIHLISEDKIDDEIFVIRTQNMHSCARLAASITKEFFERGTIASRMVPLDWNVLWGDVIKGYERDWNPDIWCAIYYKGRAVYDNGERHPFIDIIEQCDTANKNEYSESVVYAQKAFSTAGKEVSIKHDSNSALVLTTSPDIAKCGIIVRAATGATTFNYTAAPSVRMKRPIQAHTTLTVAAAFLEGIQLAFHVGMMNKKVEFKLIDKYTDDYRHYERSQRRLINLNTAISNYESNFKVTYRPDRPNFQEMVAKAENLSVKILKKEIEAKIADGTLDKPQWVE